MKLIFLDIDGTLTSAGSNVPPESALEAIRAAQAKGNKVYLCTGRNYAMMKPLLKYGFDGYVASSGGYVVNGDEVLFDCPMSDEQWNTAIKAFHDNDVFCTVETKDVTYGDENLGEFLKQGGDGNSELLRWRKAIEEKLDIVPISKFDGKAAVYKIVFICKDESQLTEAREKLEKDFNFVIQGSPIANAGILNGEFINRAFDKGRGILMVAEKEGVSVADTYGFGDSMNDLEMIETVGTSVVMANGNEELKKRADVICPSVEEDGLMAAFKQLGLC